MVVQDAFGLGAITEYPSDFVGVPGQVRADGSQPPLIVRRRVVLVLGTSRQQLPGFQPDQCVVVEEQGGRQPGQRGCGC